MDIPLSGKQVQKIAGDSIVYTYPELVKFKNIEDAFKDKNKIILLYLSKKNYGHWTGLIKRTIDGLYKINHYEFFDPYGIIPDDELNWINDKFKKENSMDFKKLVYLLYKNGNGVEYNSHRFQKKEEDISTCGRHVGIRLYLDNLSLENYYKFLKSIKDKYKISYDEIVYILSESFLN